MATRASSRCKYSCDTAAETLEWINAIIQFIKPYTFLTNAHVVNFFTDRLWEALHKDWIDCLRQEPVQNLLLIPSGAVQDHWPASLQHFVLTIRSLVFPRDKADLQEIFPGLLIAPLKSVLSQGMNVKKKHEVEILSGLVDYTAKKVGAHTVIDVGAGQGYLAQVLSFQYQHSVVAIDACSHHGSVTNARAERIKKHYAAQLRKSGAVNASLNVPKTITCQVSSIDMLKAMRDISIDSGEQPKVGSPSCGKLNGRELKSSSNGSEPCIVLAGLHACGDLSVTMLRAFVECNDIKAVVSIGCCYNLLSEEESNGAGSLCGFPMSSGVKIDGLLGKCARDLACQDYKSIVLTTKSRPLLLSIKFAFRILQSAERWRTLEKDDGLHNFELHSFRAAFQMVLHEYYPEVLMRSPSIGRQGKAIRRQQRQRKILDSSSNPDLHMDASIHQECRSSVNESCLATEHNQVKTEREYTSGSDVAGNPIHDNVPHKRALYRDKFEHFENFVLSSLQRLSLKPPRDMDLSETWNALCPLTELIGPYWSIRAALGGVLETLILLDRLLFLQEQGTSLKTFMLPIFDPSLSPRNVAVIAMKISEFPSFCDDG